MRWIVDQHQVSEEVVCSKAAQSRQQTGEVEVREHIAVHHDERLVTDERESFGDAASGLQRSYLGRIDDRNTEAAAVAQAPLDLLASQAWLITIRSHPARCSFSTCHCSSGLPPTSSRTFGSRSLSGRMRSPRPAASIIARISKTIA
jgi:hypothetical protein